MRKSFVLLGLMVLTAWGCTFFCPKATCEPEIRFERVDVPVYVGVRITLPDCPELPELPPFPGPDATPEQKKEWAVTVGEIRDSKDALNEACIDALTLMISTVNDHADMIDEAWEPVQ